MHVAQTVYDQTLLIALPLFVSLLVYLSNMVLDSSIYAEHYLNLHSTFTEPSLNLHSTFTEPSLNLH